MSDTRRSDRQARRAAQTIFDRPLLLEAGAGTGKTTTLIARALCWCLGPGWERAELDLERADGDTSEPAIAAETLHGVVAITFTEAAAAEMASRLASSLALIVDGDEAAVIGFDADNLPASLSTEERQQRATRLLESFDYLTVGTIHAFCYSLLKSYPLEAGLHPDLRVDADGSELETIARGAVEHWVQQAYTAGEETPFLALAGHGIGPGRLLEAVTRWFAEGPPIEILDADPLHPGAVGDFLDALELRTVEVVRLLGDRLRDLREDRVARRVERALGLSLELLSGPRPEHVDELNGLLGALRDAWPDNAARRVHDWGKGKLPSAEERDRLGDLGEPLTAATLNLDSALRTAAALDPELLAAARQALLPLLRTVEAELRTRGVITFSGLLRQTLSLLHKSRTVLDRERRRLRLLLVDEFQDTDPVQSEIVRLLALEARSEARPSLFVVGDPKQSIYAWRDADLAAYESFEQALLAAGGASHALSVNFRSVPRVLSEVESVIAPVMHYEHGIQPTFKGLEPFTRRQSRPDPNRAFWRPVEYWVSWSPDGDTGHLRPAPHAEALEIEAGELAADIKRLHDGAGVAWSRIGVLFRKSGSQPPFLDEMRRQGIPFAVTRDRNYYQRREVIEAAAWVRAIINPTDHLALLTVLRSIVVGVPDAALIPLWSRSFPQLVTELGGASDADLDTLRRVVEQASAVIPPSVPGLERVAGWEESLLAGLASLIALRRSYQRDAADVFVRRLRQELLLEVSEGARFQGKFRLANLNRFFRQLETAMESDEADVHAILRALRLGVMEAREAEEAMPRDAAEEAVQVMTIHTAKGLEFDHVYIAQMHSRTRTGGNELIEATEVEPEDWEYRLFGAQTLGYERAEARRAHVEAAEAVRTLYVAMTRARQRVVLIGVWPRTIEPVDPLEARDYVQLVQNRGGLPPSLAEPANDPAVQLAGHWDHEDIRFRFLGGSHRHLAGWHAAETPDWLPSSGDVERLAEEHRQRQQAARQRLERSWSAAATAEIGERLEQLASSFRRESGAASTTPGAARRTSQRIGSAIHDCLQHWRLDEDPPSEARTQRARLGELLHGDDEAIEQAREILDRFAEGRLLEKLVGLEGQILGREIPALVAPDDDGPVGCYSGAIDMLYRDPSSGEAVIVDYKTDRIEKPAELRRRAEAYEPQERLYSRAVQEMLQLDAPPRTELWFLWPDRIVTSDDHGRRL